VTDFTRIRLPVQAKALESKALTINGFASRINCNANRFGDSTMCFDRSALDIPEHQ
jgi:hypothetical protein